MAGLEPTRVFKFLVFVALMSLSDFGPFFRSTKKIFFCPKTRLSVSRKEAHLPASHQRSSTTQGSTRCSEESQRRSGKTSLLVSLNEAVGMGPLRCRLRVRIFVRGLSGSHLPRRTTPGDFVSWAILNFGAHGGISLKICSLLLAP